MVQAVSVLCKFGGRIHGCASVEGKLCKAACVMACIQSHAGHMALLFCTTTREQHQLNHTPTHRDDAQRFQLALLSTE
jgi:hypothetical protein